MDPTPSSDDISSSLTTDLTTVQLLLLLEDPVVVTTSIVNNDENENSFETANGKDDDDNNNINENINDNDNTIDIRHWIQNNILLGNEPTPDVLAIVTIYFVEGALGLARLAQTYLLKDELQLGPVELSALTGLFTLPWTIKPLYGFLSDGFPLFGYRRKSYLMAAGLLGSLSYGILGQSEFWQSITTSHNNNPQTAIVGTVAALLISSACIAMSDVVADGIVVTKTREMTTTAAAAAATSSSSNDNNTNTLANAGSLQSLCWGAASIGGLLSAYFSGSLLEVMTVRQVFGITAILPFLVAVIALGMQEEPIVKTTTTTTVTTEEVTAAATESTLDEWNPLRGDEETGGIVQQQVASLLSALKQPSIWRPALFLFLWQSTPTTDGAFFFFLTNDLHLGPEFLGRVRLVTAGASLLGVWLYQQYFRAMPIKNLLKWCTIVSVPLGMIPVLLTTHINRQLGIPDTALIVGDDVVLAALGQISFLPTLVLAAKLCPVGIEAVLFATLMSIFNGAGAVGTEVGALLTKVAGVTDTNFDNLSWLIVLCNLTSLYPLLFLNWLDGVGDVSEEEMELAANHGISVEPPVQDTDATLGHQKGLLK